MNHVKLMEEEKIKLVSVTDDDLRRQQAFTPDIYNFHQCQHTALINLLTEANHARLVTETTAVHWRQRFEEEHRKLDLNSSGESKRKRLCKYNLTTHQWWVYSSLTGPLSLSPGAFFLTNRRSSKAKPKETGITFDTQCMENRSRQKCLAFVWFGGLQIRLEEAG